MHHQELSVPLREHCAKREFVWVVRSEGENLGLGGIPLVIGRHYFLLAFLDDFAVNGYKIVPFSTICSIRYAEEEEFYQRVLTNESINVVTPSVGTDAFDSPERCFHWLRESGQVVTLEQEGADWSDLHVGRLTAYNSGTVELAAIDATGNWMQGRERIAANTIKLIGFGDRYSTLLAKYAKEKSD